MLQGFRTVLSSPWYINLGEYAGDDWAQYYAVEPLSFKVCHSSSTVPSNTTTTAMICTAGRHCCHPAVLVTDSASCSWDDSVCQPGVFTENVVTRPSVKGRQHATLWGSSSG